MEIRSARLLLRSWRTEDADALPRHVNHREVWRNTGALPFPYSRTDAENFFKYLAEHPEEAHLAIVPEHEPVGSVGIYRRKGLEQYVGELGYWLGPSYWGRGCDRGGSRADGACVRDDGSRAHRGARVRVEPSFVSGAGEGRLHARGPAATRCIQRRPARRRVDLRTVARVTPHSPCLRSFVQSVRSPMPSRRAASTLLSCAAASARRIARRSTSLTAASSSSVAGAVSSR